VSTICRVVVLLIDLLTRFYLILVGRLVRVGGGWGIGTEKFVHCFQIVIDEHIVQVAVGKWVVRVSISLPLFLST
jgi:hypothetical protein